MNKVQTEEDQKFRQYVSAGYHNTEILKRKYGKHWKVVLENMARRQAIKSTARLTHDGNCSCCGM